MGGLYLCAFKFYDLSLTAVSLGDDLDELGRVEVRYLRKGVVSSAQLRSGASSESRAAAADGLPERRRGTYMSCFTP